MDSVIHGERILSRDHYVRLIPEMYQKTAELLGITTDQIDRARPFMERTPLRESLRDLSFCLADRVLPERLLEHKAAGFLNRDDVSTSKVTKISLKEGQAHTVLRHGDDPSKRIKLFPFTGQHPNWNKLCPYGKSPLDADYRLTYAIYLPDDQYRELEPYILGRKNDHVTNALAYLHYYQLNGIRLVSEIQSDVYGRLTDRGLKEKYKHWAEVLLLSFQLDHLLRHTAYASLNRSVENQPAVTAIADSEWVRKRWPLSFHMAEQAGSRDEDYNYVSYGIAESLAKQLYEKIPEKLGFEKMDFPIAEFEKTPDGNPIKLKMAWLSQPSLEGFQKLFFECMDVSELHADEVSDDCFLSIQQMDSFEGGQGVPAYFSINRSLIYKGQDLTEKVRPHLEWVPQIQVKLDAECGVTQDMLDEWRYCLNSEQVKDIAVALSPDFTWLSKGEPSKSSSCLWTGMSSEDPDGTFVQMEFDSPVVKLGNMFLITEGAGFAESISGDFHKESPPGSRHTFNLSDPEKTFLAWTDAGFFRKTFVSTLNLRSLLRKAGVESPNLPIPLDIGMLHMIPVWHGNDTVWHTAEDYFYSSTTDPDWEREGSTYRYLEPCHIQFKTWLDSLGTESHKYGTNPAESLRLGLSSLYQYQGCEFNGGAYIHDNFIVEEKSGLIANLGIFNKLAEINRDAASQVFNKISSDIFYTFGVLHGAGGDLNGCWQNDFTLAGTFHIAGSHFNRPQIRLGGAEEHLEHLASDAVAALYAADTLSLILLGKPDESYTRLLESIGLTYQVNLFEGYLDFKKYYSGMKWENVDDFFSAHLEPYMPLAYLRGRSRGIEIRTFQERQHFNEWEW